MNSLPLNDREKALGWIAGLSCVITMVAVLTVTSDSAPSPVPEIEIEEKCPCRDPALFMPEICGYAQTIKGTAQ